MSKFSNLRIQTSGPTCAMARCVLMIKLQVIWNWNDLMNEIN